MCDVVTTLLVEVVGLVPLDECLRYGFDVPQPAPVELTLEIIRTVCDRVLDTPCLLRGHRAPNGLSAFCSQLERHVVESRAQIVNSVTDKQSEAVRRLRVADQDVLVYPVFRL